MANPWLSIPLSDYEGHMDSAEVRQLWALSDLFAEAIAYQRPASVAVLGVAGGNGLDRIDSRITTRVGGFDVNPRYLDAVRQRYSHLPGLELHCADLAEMSLNWEPVQLVHAALVFEHAGVGQCLENALSLVAPDGTLSVVLQLPSSMDNGVSTTPFSSMQILKSHFSLIDRAWFSSTLAVRGWGLVHETERSLPAGKAFWMGVFRRA